jgi:putative ubiquitin-RnfH superfamily antitoxin RatB of RatAB toxin-antitoxin module
MRCTVIYATRARQYRWELELAPEASVADALAAARALAGPGLDVPWESAPVGVFGERRLRGERLAEGDRVELYRTLTRDPRARRRERVQRERSGKR